MTDRSSTTIAVHRVPAALVQPLRAAILRPGRPLDESVYPFDEHSEAAHFAAFDASGMLVGSASVFYEAANGPHVPRIAGEGDPWRAASAWRLRGMAVVKSMRGRSIGAGLLHATFAHLDANRATCLWCHARAAASDFYRRHGFIGIGEEYHLPSIGAHVFMSRAMARSRD